ncbi:MAG: hypothetical protein IJM08_02895, partial [Firmicutes bacterium]|nr:hypothetical protein [Bacillota bacterium]
SIFLVIILASVTGLIITVTGAAFVKGSGSLAESLCLVTGRSLLSEYQRELADRYGIFLFRASEEKLAELAEFYIQSHIEKSDMFLKLALESVSVNTEEYPALDTDLFMKQVSGLGKICAAKTVISAADLGSVCEWLGQLGGISLKDIKESINALSVDIPDEDTEGMTDEEKKAAERRKKDAEEEARQLEDIKYDLRKSTESPDYDKEENGGEERSVDPELAEALPSGLLGFGRRNSLLLSGGIFDAAEGFFCNEYIVYSCGNALKETENCFLKAECEYVLFGKPSDSQNRAAFKRSLFYLRLAVRTAENLKDPAKLASYEASAASLPFIPAPAAIAALAAIEGGTQAKADVAGVCSGLKVGLGGSAAFGSYSDYLRLMLLLLPTDEKAARLMDLMELNISKIEGCDFCFQDYAAGFELNAVFSKGTIDQKHEYL